MESLTPRRLLSASVFDYVSGDKHAAYDHLKPEAQAASITILKQFGKRTSDDEAFAEADLNHDHRVNTSDFNLLARDLTPPRSLPFQSGVTDFSLLADGSGTSRGGHWFNGDFNYDGAVNTTDFNLLASSFGSSLEG